MKTFFEALLLVVIIVWLFLRNFHATIIALLAIPVSIVATFAVFPSAGFTINTLTLFAMILAIGLVDDDAIVVIEIVERNLERGMEVHEATLAAMQEIQAPIIAIACVLAAVFVPTALLEGTTSELYRQFALTIVVSMFFSTLVALTPALCVMLLKRRDTAQNFSAGGAFQRLLEFFMALKELDGVESLSVVAGAVSIRLLDVRNHSDDELAALAEAIEVAANERDEFEDVTESFTVSKPYVDVRVDEDKAKLLGVNLDDIYSTLRVNFSGDEVNDF